MRALMLDPRVILLDEPMGALDPMVRAELQADLRAIFRSLEKTVIMVTHDLAEAGWFGDEILLMRDGRIVQRGTLRQLSTSPPTRSSPGSSAPSARSSGLADGRCRMTLACLLLAAAGLVGRGAVAARSESARRRSPNR